MDEGRLPGVLIARQTISMIDACRALLLEPLPAAAVGAVAGTRVGIANRTDLYWRSFWGTGA